MSYFFTRYHVIFCKNLIVSYDSVEHSGISQFEFRVSDWEIFISAKLTEAFIVEYAAKHLD